MSYTTSAVYAQRRAGAGAITLTGDVLPVLKNRDDDYYSPALVAAGATAPLAWLLTGAPAHVVIDHDTGEFGGYVNDNIVFVTTSLMPVLKRAPYADALFAAYMHPSTAGTFTYSLSSGPLPTGITLAASGAITGTAT